MSILKNMKIRSKLFFSFGLAVIFQLVTNLVSIYYVSDIAKDGSIVGKELSPLADAAMEVKINAFDAHLSFEELASGDSTRKIEDIYKKLDEAIWYANVILEGGKNEKGEYFPSKDPKVIALAKEVKQDIINFKDVTKQRYELTLQLNSASSGTNVNVAKAGSEADAKFDAIFDEFLGNMDVAEEEIQRTIDAGIVDMDNNAKTSNMIMIIILISSVVIATIFAIVITNSIAKPINYLKDKLDVIANGDLTVDIVADTKDETGMALKSMEKMIGKLKEIITSIVSTADSISSASSEMNNSAQLMSEGATEQASSAEEVSSSMEEMAANIQQNTDNAKQTEKIAEKASVDIKDGNDAVNKTVDSMKIIANKISIIGEIARQTNLLALNAAVEAARAGEHGKGFAVVAAEVRKLAERSQLAASEIDQVSTASVEVAIKSGKLLEELVPSIQKTSDLVQEIAAASIEQNTGADQVNNAIQQLNQVIQQNAATAEQLSASAEELNAQADMLKDVVSFFKVDNGSFSSARRTVAKKPISVNKVVTVKESPKLSGSGIQIDLGKQGGHDQFDKDYEKY